jgi:hypothetical protein
MADNPSSTTAMIEEDKDANNINRKQIEYDGPKIFYGMFSEALFIILPFIVIAITLGHRGQLTSFFALPEWSIVSAVIVGQMIVRCVSVLFNRSIHTQELFVFMVASILVLLLVPILILLTIVLTSEAVTRTLQIAQAILFLLSLVVFSWGSLLESIAKQKDSWKG